jgi:hypothetical protein
MVEAVYEEYDLELLGVLLLNPLARESGAPEGVGEVAVNEYESRESPGVEAESEPLDETDLCVSDAPEVNPITVSSLLVPDAVVRPEVAVYSEVAVIDGVVLVWEYDANEVNVVVLSCPVVGNDVSDGRDSLDLPEPEKKASSGTDSSEPDLLDDLSLDPLPMLGGGVTNILDPRLDPLETVTGEPPLPTGTSLARPDPNPSPDLPALARPTADANSWSKSVSELIRLSELLRLGGMRRGSPGYK